MDERQVMAVMMALLGVVSAVVAALSARVAVLRRAGDPRSAWRVKWVAALGESAQAAALLIGAAMCAAGTVSTAALVVTGGVLAANAALQLALSWLDLRSPSPDGAPGGDVAGPAR